MLRIPDTDVIEVMDAKNKPAAKCKSGDTVVFCTRDCYDNGVTSPERPNGDFANMRANPATGPLYVEGAEKGDTLKVEIVDIQLRSWGAMRCSTSAGAFPYLYKQRQARIFDLSRDMVEFDERVQEPVDTMIGVIGTAPEGEGIDTETPDLHGGNMDCNKIVTGATLYLPVNVDGALLAMGDLHARMGDGEVFICGLETAGEVTVRVTALKGVKLPTPFVVCRGNVMTVQSAKTLEEASLLAARGMQRFLRDATGKDDFDTGMLMSLFSNLIICQIVDPQMTVRSEFPMSILKKYGYRLP